MSRSRKYPAVQVTHQIDKDHAHKRVRKFVKQKLQSMDMDDIPILDIEVDTRQLGEEEWGTRFGFDTSEIMAEDDWWAKEKIRMSRK